MNHPNEQGEVQYYKVTLRDTMRWRFKAKLIRLRANMDALGWYLRNMWRQ